MGSYLSDFLDGPSGVAERSATLEITEEGKGGRKDVSNRFTAVL